MSERKIIDYEQFRKNGRNIELWESLPLAPKHSDEEYETLATRFDLLNESWWLICKDKDELQSRIKELEVELRIRPEHFAIGQVHDTRRCQCPDCMQWKKERGLPTEMTFSRPEGDTDEV